MCSRSTRDRIPDDKFNFNYMMSKLKIIIENRMSGMLVEESSTKELSMKGPLVHF